MVLTIETGAAIVGADSYASSAEAVAYLDNRYGAANAFTFAGDPDLQDQWMRKAATYVDGFVVSFPGYRVSIDQGLQAPRLDWITRDGWCVGSSTIPAQLKSAQMEAAYWLALNPTKSLLPPQASQSGELTAKRIKAGPVEIEKSFGVGTAQQAVVLPVVEALLAPLMGRGGEAVLW